MNIFRLSWWLTPVISFNWVRARDLGVVSKHEECLTKLAFIQRLRGPDIRPMGQWTTEYYILQGHAFYSLGRKDRATTSFARAFQEMDKPNDYIEDDMNYLSAFIISCHEDLELENKNNIEIEQIDLDMIQSELKMYYPLKSHPDWEHSMETDPHMVNPYETKI